jgi:tetratricopeptide (TPR) repeat protein
MNGQAFIYRFACLVFIIFTFSCSTYFSKNAFIGDYKLSQKNYGEAIERFEQDLSENPDNWRVREKLGYAYLKTDQYDKAITEFEEVLRENPKRPYATYYLGIAYLKNGNRSKAIDVFKSYRNKEEPLIELQVKKHLTVLEMVESLNLAKAAVQQEKELKTLQPKAETVAVFYFKDLSPDHRFLHLQKAIAAMIITDLSQVESLQVLERMRVQYLLTEMEMGQTGIVEKKTAPKTGRLLGAENLIVGTFNTGSFWVNTSVASTTESQLKGSVAVHSEMDEFYILQKELVYKILQVLDVKLTPKEKAKFSEYHTKNLQAVVYFGQGLEALDMNEWKEAKEYFQRAFKEDPSFGLAKKFKDGCPDADTPTISVLAAMSPTGLANMLDGDATDASAAQSEISQTLSAPDHDSSDSKKPSNTGNITISW